MFMKLSYMKRRKQRVNNNFKRDYFVIEGEEDEEG